MSVDEIERLSESMRQLRVEYDRYFMGLERLEPLKARDEVKKVIRRLISEPSKNTARRFRLQSLQASFITYEAHWNRIARQIEEGTFKRDRLRAQAMLQEERAEKPLEPEIPPAPKYPESIRRLHEAFEEARQKLGGESKPVSIASLAATVQKQVAAIKAQYNCKSVEFKVIVKDGRPILKAIPK